MLTTMIKYLLISFINIVNESETTYTKRVQYVCELLHFLYFDKNYQFFIL